MNASKFGTISGAESTCRSCAPERDDKGRIMPYREKLVKVKRKLAARRGAYRSGRRRPSIQIALYGVDEECRRLGELARKQGFQSVSQLAQELLFKWLRDAGVQP